MGTGCVNRTPIMFIAYPAVLWTCYIISMLLVAFGLFGNILSYMILGYDKTRRNQSSTFYLQALAVADCLALLCNTLLTSQQMMLRPAMRLSPVNPVSLLVNSFPACNIRMYISYSSIMISVYIIVLFSIERALVLANPFRWSRRLTLRKARIAVAVLIVSSCLLSSPALFSFNRFEVRHPKRLYWNHTGATFESEELLSRAKCGGGSGGGASGNSGGPPDAGRILDGSVGDIAFHDDGNSSAAQLGQEFNSGLLSELATPLSVKLNTSRPRTVALPVNMSRYLLRGGISADFPDENRFPPGVVLECQQVAECRINFDVFKPFAVFHIVSLSVVPFIVTGLCNLVILLALRRRDDGGHDMRKASATPQAAEQVDRQVTKRLILVSTTYILLSFPLALYHIVTDAMSGSYCYVWAANTLIITLTLNYGNFGVNFLIYCLSEEQFRRLLASLLHCRQQNFTRMLSYVARPRHHHRHHRGHQLGGGQAGGATGGVTGGVTTDRRYIVARSGQTGAGTKPDTSSTTAFSESRRRRNRQAEREQQQQKQQEQEQEQQLEEALLLSTVCNTDSSAATADVLVHREPAASCEADNDTLEKQHNFRNCSLVQDDDWSSSQFSEGNIGGSFKKDSAAGNSTADRARWSQVLPESPTEI